MERNRGRRGIMEGGEGGGSKEGREVKDRPNKGFGTYCATKDVQRGDEGPGRGKQEWGEWGKNYITGGEV